MADQDGVGLVHPAVQAHRAVFHHAAFDLEQEQVVKIGGRVGVAHVRARERPLVQGGAPVEAAMGRLVVLALDPGPQGAVQRVEALGGLGAKVGEPGGAKGSEEALDLALPRGLVGSGVDERDAELGAHQGELLGAEVRAVVGVQPGGQPPARDGVLEHGQEGGGVLGVGEGGEGNHPGGVVDERDEEGFSAPAPVADLRPVHHVTHPQLAGVAEGEPSPVGGHGLAGAFVEQPFAREQPVHRGGGEGVVGAALAGGFDERFDRQRGPFGLERDEQLGDLGGQAPGPAAVGAGLGVQRLEPAVAIQTEPIAHRLHGHAGAARAGDGVGALGLLVEGAPDLAAAGGQAQHVGDETVAEQRHGLAQLVVAVVHGVVLVGGGRIGPGRTTLRTTRWRIRPHLVLAGAKAVRRPETVGLEPQRCGQHGELLGEQGAKRPGARSRSRAGYAPRPPRRRTA